MSGFFHLSSQAELEISYSEVKGTIGKVASVAYLTTGSTLKMHHMELNDLGAPTECRYENSGVIVG